MLGGWTRNRFQRPPARTAESGSTRNASSSRPSFRRSAGRAAAGTFRADGAPPAPFSSRRPRPLQIPHRLGGLVRNVDLCEVARRQEARQPRRVAPVCLHMVARPRRHHRRRHHHAVDPLRRERPLESEAGRASLVEHFTRPSRRNLFSSWPGSSAMTATCAGSPRPGIATAMAMLSAC
jgi:hypothetical protein